MDVLRPPVIWIGGRCYRKNPIKQFEEEEGYQRGYDEEDQVLDTEDAYQDEVCDAFTNIEETPSGYRLAMQIPSAYFKFIIGKKAETKKRLENETRTQLRIPKAGQEGDVVIEGRDRKGVLSAKTRIDILVESGRQKQPFTHFISFPVTSPGIKDGLLKFKEEVLETCKGDRGLDGTIFQNADKLHITVGILALMSDAEIQRATDILQQCQQDIIDAILQGSPLQARLRGLEYMNDDPGEVDVLYAKIQLDDGSDRLQTVADLLVDKFVSSGLMKREYDRVKLHVTVMNTLMRKDPSGVVMPRNQRGNLPPMRERESFNAANILREFGDYDFGPHHIDSIHLSSRYGTDCQGYYNPAATISLP